MPSVMTQVYQFVALWRRRKEVVLRHGIGIVDAAQPLISLLYIGVPVAAFLGSKRQSVQEDGA